MRKSDDISIIFFNSPIYEEKTDDGENYLPPLGQGYIVTKLNQDGIKAVIVDCVNERMGLEEIVSLIDQSTVTNIAFNVFSVNLNIIKKIVNQVTRRVNWFFGGKAMNSLWSIMREWDWKGQNVTYTIGECELLYTDLLLDKSLEQPFFLQDNQRAYRIDRNSVYYPTNLDDIELDRTLFCDRIIKNHYGQVECCMVTSRGCVYNCAFCGGSRYSNKNELVRERSVQGIIKEIDSILKVNPNVQSVRILDDLFLKNRNSIRHAIEIWKNFPDLNWRCMAHISSLKGNADLFPLLSESGCKELFIGIESGSTRVRQYIHKEGTVLDIKNIIEQLLQLGIDVKGYFICGFPTESREELDETVSLARRLNNLASSLPGNFRATAFQFRPYHGTELYDKLISAGEYIEEYHMVKNTSSKKQYSYIVKNYSEASDEYVNTCIRAITGE